MVKEEVLKRSLEKEKMGRCRNVSYQVVEGHVKDGEDELPKKKEGSLKARSLQTDIFDDKKQSEVVQ